MGKKSDKEPVADRRRRLNRERKRRYKINRENEKKAASNSSKDIVRQTERECSQMRLKEETPEGARAEKRIRLFCGICTQTKYYSLHRGITRIASVIACENCRHFYQRVRRERPGLNCVDDDKGSCYRDHLFSVNNCKACLLLTIINNCPHPGDIFEELKQSIPLDLKHHIIPTSLLPDDFAEQPKGSLAFEIKENNEWIEVDLVSSELKYSDSSNEEATWETASRESSIEKKIEDFLAVNETNALQNPGMSNSDVKIESKESVSEKLDSELKTSSISKNSNLKEILTQKMTEQEMSDNVKQEQEEIKISNVDTVLLKSPTNNENAEDDKLEVSKDFTDGATGVGGESSMFTGNFDELDEENQSSTPPEMDDGAVELEEEEIEEEFNIADGTNDIKLEEESIDDPGLPDSNETKKISNGRVRRKKRVEYFTKPKPAPKQSKGKGTLYGPDGRIQKTGKDLCDCLLSECPGCHFPCPKCRSPKCGNDCRVNRRWYYEKVEVEGTKICFFNRFVPRI